ncbi:putative glutaminyl cyclase [Eremomyces bilateralis CBS 781.70]|uniref:Peptide hydrolase n=1 Tax=Eremomyces bilateralis CBS 781.70 TaxID=1392243 RepID=A0A6G1FXR0_9PEZI|nr:putative glutaminyl cyclase [Eremomyces bilateralis CBS 781.70]KAF1810456.1 putative glutaminyl cyclase [Eremomyces bilateralis CBS 781.70]
MKLRGLLFALLGIGCTAYTPLSDKSLNSLPGPGSDFDIHNGALLAPILTVRVPGTPTHEGVMHHLAGFFREQLPDWKLEWQNSTSTTPATGDKQVPFRNLIATRDPPWAREGDVGRLALVAHYDSKLTPTGFIGATDSAAPCAMILHAARSLDKALTKKWAAMEADGSAGIDEETGIQILFLDGEEAFSSWTDTDSLYGARSLSETWEKTMHPAPSTYKTLLSSITLFMLLDLLGGANPTIPSYFATTHWAYRAMASLEHRLRSAGRFKSSPNHISKRSPDAERVTEPRWLIHGDKQDNQGSLAFMVEDDHIPFMARGVEVLHMIPSPFPAVWHRIEDDGAHLDPDTVEDWSTLVIAFAAEWMDLEGFIDTGFVTREENAGSGKGRREMEGKSELTNPS